jgi:hypothetical protein
VVVDVREVASGYRVSKLLRSHVANDQDEDIGTLDDLIIGRDEDRILFAILQVGGFLGIGGRLVAVPFDSLELARADGRLKMVLRGATRDALRESPECAYA